jgi:hypothetical protein
MTPLIDLSVATNIAAHTKQAWTYSTPNDDTAESIIVNGLLPFHPAAEQRGGSTTIVDVKVNHVALDVKCRDVIGFFNTPPTPRQIKSRNQYCQLSNNLWIRIPNGVLCPVRRPKTNTQAYQGNPQTAILDQIQEYINYANRTTMSAGCSELHSVLFLYGQGHGYKAIYIEEQDFGCPVPASFHTYHNRKKIAAAYDALDSTGGLLYRISDYSKGSTNFNRRFDLNQGYLFVWPSTALSTQTTTPAQWTQAGNFSTTLQNPKCTII